MRKKEVERREGQKREKKAEEKVKRISGETFEFCKKNRRLGTARKKSIWKRERIKSKNRISNKELQRWTYFGILLSKE